MTENDKDFLAKSTSMLGLSVWDKVTGLKGTVVSMTFDLYGCVQAIVAPKAPKDSTEIPQSVYLDIDRLVDLEKPRVMPLPEFAKLHGMQGPADKPAPNV